MNEKAIKEYSIMERAKEQGVVDNYRRSKVYLGKKDTDFGDLSGSKRYEIKSVVQRRN